MTGFQSKRAAARERYADPETIEHIIDLRKRLDTAEWSSRAKARFLMDREMYSVYLNWMATVDEDPGRDFEAPHDAA